MLKSKHALKPFSILKTKKPKLPEKFEVILVGQSYEIVNGVSGMKRDIVVRLCGVLGHKTGEIRAIIGMSGEHYQWKSHSLFLKARPRNILVTFRPDHKANCNFDETVAIIGTKIRYNLERDVIVFLDKILTKGVFQWTLRLEHYSTKAFASYSVGVALTEKLNNYYDRGFTEGHLKLITDIRTGHLTAPRMSNVLMHHPNYFCYDNSDTEGDYVDEAIWSMPAPLLVSVPAPPVSVKGKGKVNEKEESGKEEEGDGGVLITAEIDTYARTFTFVLNGEPAPYGISDFVTGRMPFLFGVEMRLRRMGEKTPAERASVTSLLFRRMPSSIFASAAIRRPRLRSRPGGAYFSFEKEKENKDDDDDEEEEEEEEGQEKEEEKKDGDGQKRGGMKGKGKGIRKSKVSEGVKAGARRDGPDYFFAEKKRKTEYYKSYNFRDYGSDGFDDSDISDGSDGSDDSDIVIDKGVDDGFDGSDIFDGSDGGSDDSDIVIDKGVDDGFDGSDIFDGSDGSDDSDIVIDKGVDDGFDGSDISDGSDGSDGSDTSDSFPLISPPIDEGVD